MKLTKNDFRGTKAVYRFTLKQLVSNRANLISFIISLVIILAVFPLMSFFDNDGNEEIPENSNQYSEFDYSEYDSVPPMDVFFLNETDISVSLDKEVPPVVHILYPNAPMSESELSDGEMFIHVYLDNGGYKIDITDKTGHGRTIGDYTYNALYREIMSTFENADALSKGYSVNIYASDEYSADGHKSFSMGSYYLQMIYTIIVMIVSMYAAAYIVQSVVEEKVSKLVETLMISVKPLALILGKILAVMTFVFGMMTCYLAVALIGNFISKSVCSGSGVASMLFLMDINLSEMNLDIIALISAVISLLLGYMTYSLIAGMSGAGCSEQEDIQSANSTSIMIIMACYIVALTVSEIDIPAVQYAVSLIPMISIFCAPVQYMLGSVSLPILILSWIIQIAVIIFLALMCARIYEDLLIYRGKRLTFFDIFKMAKNKKQPTKCREE